MSRIIAYLARNEALLCANGECARTYLGFDPEVEGVPLGSFVSCAGLFGTLDLAPRDVVVLGTKDRRRFMKALPLWRSQEPTAARELEAALAALPFQDDLPAFTSVCWVA